MSDGGAIRTLWVFDAAQGVQVATKAERAIQGVQRATTGLSTAEARAALTAGKLATEQQKTSIASTNAARASQLLARDTALAAAAQDRAALSAQRRAAAEARAAQAPAAGLGTRGGLSILPRELTQFGPEALNQIKSGLLGVVGPAAAVTAGFAAVGKAIDLTEQGFKLKAVLDETNRSIAIQLRGVRDSAQVFQQASTFAAKYGLTQEETNQALLASVGILRNSTSSADDLLGVLARLQIVSPEQSLQEAALAVKELQSGDITSLVKRFEISRSAANKMKEEIKGGGDAVTAIAGYLDDAGVGMDVLANRTTGAAGKMRLLAQEGEKFKLALGGEAGGVGEAILDARIAAFQTLTADLSGKGDLAGANQAFFASLIQGQGLTAAYAERTRVLNASLEDAAGTTREYTDIEGARIGQIHNGIGATQASIHALSEEAQKKIDSQIATAQLAQQQAQLERDSQLAAQGLFGAGNQALLLAQKYGIAASEAQFLIRQQQQLSNATALADQRVGERDPSNNLTAAQNEKFGKIARQGAIDRAADQKRITDKAAQDAERLDDLRLQGRLTNAKDSAAKIAILQGQLAKTTDPIERQQLQNQIDQERLSTAKSLGTAADKRLKIEESTYDSIQKQRDAMLDIEELTITGRQKDRDDVQKLKTANAIRAALGDRTDARAQDLRGRAEDAAALIDVQNRKRDFELEQKRATAGGAITSQGRLLQSQAGGGTPAPAGASAGGASGAPTAPSAAAGTMTVNVIIDGKVAWSGMSSYAWEDFIKGARALQVGG